MIEGINFLVSIIIVLSMISIVTCIDLYLSKKIVKAQRELLEAKERYLLLLESRCVHLREEASNI